MTTYVGALIADFIVADGLSTISARRNVKCLKIAKETQTKSLERGTTDIGQLSHIRPLIHTGIIVAVAQFQGVAHRQ